MKVNFFHNILNMSSGFKPVRVYPALAENWWLALTCRPVFCIRR